MHHSNVAYWRYLQSLPQGHEDLPSPRVCKLLLRMFQRWEGRPGWLVEEQVGHLFRGQADVPQDDHDALAALPVIVRKALAVERMLEIILDPVIAESSGSSEILTLARAALARGGASVASVATSVGYTSQSAFSQAFRSAFGVPPKVDARSGK